MQNRAHCDKDSHRCRPGNWPMIPLPATVWQNKTNKQKYLIKPKERRETLGPCRAQSWQRRPWPQTSEHQWSGSSREEPQKTVFQAWLWSKELGQMSENPPKIRFQKNSSNWRIILYACFSLTNFEYDRSMHMQWLETEVIESAEKTSKEETLKSHRYNLIFDKFKPFGNQLLWNKLVKS